MERAQASVVAPRMLQLEIRPDNIYNVMCILNYLNLRHILGYILDTLKRKVPSTCVSIHFFPNDF